MFWILRLKKGLWVNARFVLQVNDLEFRGKVVAILPHSISFLLEGDSNVQVVTRDEFSKRHSKFLTQIE